MTENAEPRHKRWGSYPETVLIFAGEAQVTVDLREEVLPATRKALAGVGLDEPFGILTAFNPRGVDIGAQENARRMEELERELRKSGEEFVCLDACSPDRSHCERSVALKSSRDRATDLARRWDQLAIFWWDGLAFWIYGATSKSEPMRLPK